ncbi:MAG: efflux RND transporter periplasmic adaptor subunit [Sedimentisphaerales bacterium]|nr:efflux RND transporter periplasmic adaptor subunit [Sedimentisphaerales bacterium]
MNERIALKIIGALLAMFLLTVMTIGTDRVSAFFTSVDSSGHNSHGHSHDPVEQATEATDDHVGHAPDSNNGHSHDDEVLPEQDVLNRYDVEMKVAGPGVLELQTKLFGEVKLNADRVAHVVPQVAGKVREVLQSVGDTVKTGDVLAWIESATLGQAKIDYLSKFVEISCCSIELTRAHEIHENATRLLEALETSPSLESLSETNWRPIGKIRSDLVSAYTELQYAKNAYEREKRLFDQKITSSDEFQKAESILKKVEALYNATRDQIVSRSGTIFWKRRAPSKCESWI